MADKDWVDGLKRDYRSVSLTSADRAMLDYVDKVTRKPSATEEAETSNNAAVL